MVEYSRGREVCIPISIGEGTGAGVFCRELGLELKFRLNNDCSMFQAEIFAILKAIKAIAGGHTSNSESDMIYVDSQAPLRTFAAV